VRGWIRTFKSFDPGRCLSFPIAVVKFTSSILLAGIVTALTLRFGAPDPSFEQSLDEALRFGEGETVEFKEGLRWSHWDAPGEDGAARSRSEAVVIKTVAGFLNQRGGTLLVGVADDKTIPGLDRDYQSLTRPGQGNRDRFQLHLGNLLQNLGRDVSNLYVRFGIVPVGGRDVCVVQVKPAASPVYVSETNSEILYVRAGASTPTLNPKEAVEYVQQRWPKGMRRVWNWLRRS